MKSARTIAILLALLLTSNIVSCGSEAQSENTAPPRFE